MAAMEWARLRSKVQGILNYMDEESEKNDHVINNEMYNKAILKISNEFEGLKALDEHNTFKYE